ncbi:LytR C-terminal domain-containing protein [Sphingomonas lutea]|uniref:LytR C-terminal domain-containing protein n=1 Tax=Sphingomonas lutea TaxID=1045317 RepID=A0A7G9SJ85_9SPHN|nr:LytR C-terminal domain-containing protein [Sphingomonas lutea]QNN67910.1 LytR C-terminal domain-containing protein [Sphingomonas lutea]
MTRNAKLLVAPLAMTLVSCVATDGKFDVRPISNPLAEAQKRGSPMIQEGRNLLALGSVGLALEAFRKSLRDEPASNVEALAGIAACYERMGRWDLARANYESALAIEPQNIILLNSFAAALDGQGKHSEAASIRAEIARRDAATVNAAAQEIAVAATAEIPAVQPDPVTVASMPPAPSITVALPQPRAIAQAAPTPLPVSKPIALTTGPRLERTSLGEVALVTTSQPLWRPQVVARTQQSVTVKFVPLRAAYRDTRIRLLNAARREGLAARTRVALGRKGWNRVIIGDADRVRDRTLVLYSLESADAARRLSQEFGFGIARNPRSGPLTVLLGRDSVRPSQAKS